MSEFFQHTISRKALELGLTPEKCEFNKEPFNGWKVKCLDQIYIKKCNLLQNWIDEAENTAKIKSGLSESF